MPENMEIIKKVMEQFGRSYAGVMLRIFAVCKFVIVCSIINKVPWNETTIPIIFMIFIYNSAILLTAADQGICVLVLTWIGSLSVAMIYLLILILVIVYSSIPKESDTNNDFYNFLNQNLDENNKPMVQLVLLFLFILTAAQCFLLSSALNAKLNKLKRRHEQGNDSVFLI